MSQTSNQIKEKAQSRENYFKLLSIIAHNVKGPIKYMQFITDYSLQNWDNMKPDDFFDCASVINESARNISEQVGNLLSWARIQDGTFDPDYRAFDLVESIQRELDLQKPFIRIKKINLRVPEFDKLSIVSDENLFHLAFHNLITNAIKFTDKGGEVAVDIKKDGDKILISVQDTGIGMKPEELILLEDDRSFSNPGTANEQGSGFGLRIAKELLSLIQGNVQVQSEYGIGTKVTIAIPT